MRKFIDIVSKAQNSRPSFLTEDEDMPGKPTKTRTKEPKFQFMNDLETNPTDKSVATRRGKTSSTPSVSPLDKKASGSKTRRAAKSAGANMMNAHPGAGEAMRNILSNPEQDEISDEEAAAFANFQNDWDDDVGERPVVNNDNLPAIVNKDIAMSGGKFVPEWHQVKHLPGYMLNAIRAGGRSVFRQFTDTKLEDIQMICNLPGMNSDSEVRMMAAWIRKNGVPEDSAKMSFGGGVDAEVRLWKTKDFSFLIVQDFMGIYIYAWTGGRGVHVSHDRPLQIESRKRFKR